MLLLIFDVVVDHLAGAIACTVAASTFLIVWFLLPPRQRVAAITSADSGESGS